MCAFTPVQFFYFCARFLHPCDFLPSCDSFGHTHVFSSPPPTFRTNIFWLFINRLLCLPCPRASYRRATFLHQVVAGSGISVMRRNAEAQGPIYMNHIRKGGKGGWRDVFTVMQSEQFDALYRQQMAGSGLEMDFGDGLKM